MSLLLLLLLLLFLEPLFSSDVLFLQEAINPQVGINVGVTTTEIVARTGTRVGRGCGVFAPDTDLWYQLVLIDLFLSGAVGRYLDHARNQPLVYLVCNDRSMNKERSMPSH